MTPTLRANARPATVRVRIVRAVRERLFSHGYGRLTMAELAAELSLHARQGLMQPVALDHLRLGPQEVFEKAMSIFFGGLLTPAGRKDYEKLLSR